MARKREASIVSISLGLLSRSENRDTVRAFVVCAFMNELEYTHTERDPIHEGSRAGPKSWPLLEPLPPMSCLEMRKNETQTSATDHLGKLWKSG